MSNGLKFSFPKKEKLTEKKKIEELFKEGSFFRSGPFLIRFMKKDPNSGDQFHEVLISVSKKNFKRAVDRNRIKRQLREVYRLNKYHLNNSTHFLYLGIVYVDKSKKSYEDVNQSMIHAFTLLNKKIKGHE